jgi:hypothetical protein
MGPGPVETTFSVVVCTVVVMFAFAPRSSWRLVSWVRRKARAWWEQVRPRHPTPAGRPIESIARDAWRIGNRFHRDQPGMRFAKVEGIRQAYDHVLSEACDALGIAHLLPILPPGPECDAERRRVEYLLSQAGLDLPDAA